MRSGTLRSTHLAVAVVLAACTPAHAFSDDHTDGAQGSLYSARALGARGDPGLRRRSADAGKAGANRLPAKHKLDGNDTANTLSKHYYGSAGGALTILWGNGLKKWRPRTKIVKSKRYKIGDTILIPKPPKASINPPSRDAAPPPALRATQEVPAVIDAIPWRRP